jgi:hypothetical protein
VVGGLLVSQLLTLYITPVYYVYIEGARLRLMARGQAPAPLQPRAATAAEEPALTLHRNVEGSRGRA